MRPSDEVVHVNSARLTDLALTQSTQQERGAWCRPTTPIESEARGTASSATLLSTDFFGKDFLCSGATGGAESPLPETTGFSSTPTHVSSNSAKIAGDHSVKGAALTKLRRVTRRSVPAAKLISAQSCLCASWSVVLIQPREERRRRPRRLARK